MQTHLNRLVTIFHQLLILFIRSKYYVFLSFDREVQRINRHLEALLDWLIVLRGTLII